MSTLTASKARANFYNLINEVSLHHEPVIITGKRNNAVLISEEDWKSIKETLFLLSMPGVREAIKKGVEIPLSECDENLDWGTAHQDPKE